MSENVGEKWACQVCTFKNWPKSTKCTMCLHPKSSPIIAYKKEESSISSTPKLICADSRDIKLNIDQPSSDRSNPFKKWACSSCTYLNWPKALKCTQCHVQRSANTNERDSVIRTSPTNSNSDSSAGTNIYNNEKTHQDQMLSPSFGSASCSIDQESKRRSPSAPKPSKWVCEACTYENWPKSVKCVLCFTQRHSYNDGISTSRQSSPESPTIITQNEVHDKSKSPSPVEGSSNNQFKSATICGTSSSSNNYIEERRLKHLQRRRKFIRKDIRDADYLWLNACMGVVDGDRQAVELYLNSGGSPERQLTSTEVSILGRPSAFECGYTLVHLAVRFRREDILAVLLSGTDVTSKNMPSTVTTKRVPSDFCPNIATYIRRHVASSIRQRKADFPCFFINTELVTFALPSAIEDLPDIIQEKLFNELLDRDVQKELEEEAPIINWSLELTDRLGSRLYALWNRTAGDCLLDSVLQATWGVFDRENTVRRAMADSLSECAAIFYPRWKESEAIHAHLMQFSLDESQWQQDWAILLSLASQPGSSLEQLHIFALSHVLRRPIIVYGVKYVKSFRGEAIGFARFEGVYLPLLWEPSFCWKTPVALGYTRGHFSALVPVEPDSLDEESGGATGTNIHSTNEDLQVLFLPLMTSDSKLLPIHFLTNAEIGREEELLRQWLDCCVTEGGILVAQQRIQKRPPLIKQMLDEWLHHYRTLGEMITSTSADKCCDESTQYSSDENSDKE